MTGEKDGGAAIGAAQKVALERLAQGPATSVQVGQVVWESRTGRGSFLPNVGGTTLRHLATRGLAIKIGAGRWALTPAGFALADALLAARSKEQP